MVSHPAQSTQGWLQAYAPRFRLPGHDGREYALAEALRRWRMPLVLLFPHRSACPHTREYLRLLQRESRSLLAEALVWLVFPEPLEAVQRAALGWETPFLLLADPQEEVRRRYLGDVQQAGLFLLDSDGVVEWIWVGAEETEWPPPASLPSYLRALGFRCPECGVDEPAWRAALYPNRWDT